MANYMEQVAQMLGVELEEEFYVEDSEYKYKITKDGLQWYCELGDYWNPAKFTLADILSGIRKIKKPILDDIEKEYLSSVIKPFRDRIEGIVKRDTENYEYIVIKYHNISGYTVTICFPDFEKGTMYKGMEVDKKYTLEELGL